MSTQHWFVGWDERERDAFEVCVHSLLRHSSVELLIHPLKHRELRKQHLFWREWRMDGSGQWWDCLDGRPFSTEFAFTRFLVPHLAMTMGIEGWCFFVDCDFLFVDDVAKLGCLVDDADPRLAAMCVKHDFNPMETEKMDGVIQTRYARKNWSSLVAFDIRHKANERLTPACVNKVEGSWLHQFSWLADDQIGVLPAGWNFLVGCSPLAEIHALHYTRGGPWLPGWHGGDCDELWLREREMLQHPASVKMLEAATG